MAWGAIAGAVIGGMMSSQAAKSAAGMQTAATDKAINAQERQFDITRQDQMPWLRTGQSAVTTIGDLLGLRPSSRSLSDIASELRSGGGFTTTHSIAAPSAGPEGESWMGMSPHQQGTTASRVDEAALMSEARRLFAREQAESAARSQDPSFGTLMKDFTNEDFVKDPGYDFRLSQGNKAIENAARARGVYMSPSTVKELMRYGQGFASDEFQNAWNRDMSNRTSKFNMLSGAAGGGQTAANTLATTGSNTASNIGQLVTGGANARGAATIAGANAMSGGINNAINAWQQQQWMDRLMPKNQQAIWT